MTGDLCVVLKFWDSQSPDNTWPIPLLNPINILFSVCNIDLIIYLNMPVCVGMHTFVQVSGVLDLLELEVQVAVNLLTRVLATEFWSSTRWESTLSQ